MKKPFVLWALLFCIVALMIACNVNDPVVRQETTTSTSGTEPTSASETTQLSLPKYQPGSILLEDRENDDYHFIRKYRITYYRIWGEFTSLLTEEQLCDYHVWKKDFWQETNYGETQNKMFLAEFVERYNIPRDMFEQAVDQFIIHSNLDQFDVIPEEYEPPNADIIYTFDDEVINEYYRYE